MAGYARWVEAVSIQVRNLPCKLRGLHSPKPIRLLHFSDLHASDVVPKALIESAIGTALELKPDLVCLTGDYVTVRSGWNPDWYRRTLRRLSNHLPVFATMGNHDGGWRPSGMKDSSLIQTMLRESGISVLHNRHVVFAAGCGGGHQELELVGLADWWSAEFSPRLAFPATPRQASRPRIVLSHNPDTKDKFGTREWDLMLSGHTHGGQVVLPLIGSPWAPVRDKRYLHGLASWKGKQLHVTSGVGSAGGFRLNCPPELVVLELTGPTAT